MKVEQKPAQFRTVTLTLETQEEFDNLVFFLGKATLPRDISYPHQSNYVGDIWSALKKCSS